MSPIDLDTELVMRALKVAGVRVVPFGRYRLFPEQDLAQALRVVIAEKAEEQRKGPRPYHIYGIDFGKPGSDRTVMTSIVEGYGCIGADIRGDEIGGPYSPVPQKPDPTTDPHKHEEDRFEDEGGPVKKDWDDFPKVGLEGYEQREAQREVLRKKVAAAMGWKD